MITQEISKHKTLQDAFSIELNTITPFLCDVNIIFVRHLTSLLSLRHCLAHAQDGCHDAREVDACHRLRGYGNVMPFAAAMIS